MNAGEPGCVMAMAIRWRRQCGQRDQLQLPEPSLYPHGFRSRLCRKAIWLNKEQMFARLSEFQPIVRMGKLDEGAALAALLCSREAALITRVAYDLGGGVSMR